MESKREKAEMLIFNKLIQTLEEAYTADEVFKASHELLFFLEKSNNWTDTRLQKVNA